MNPVTGALGVGLVLGGAYLLRRARRGTPQDDRQGGDEPWSGGEGRLAELQAHVTVMCESAGIRRPLRTIGAVVVGSAVAATLLGTLLVGPAGGVIFGLMTLGVFRLVVNIKTSRRRRAFADQLPDTLGLIAACLRAGASLVQAVDSVAEEAEMPTSVEFQRVVVENRLGRDLAQALREMGLRMECQDLHWAIGAIEVHREVGGDLADVLDRVVDTIRGRNRVFNQIKVLTAEGKLSAVILGGLPPVMFVVMSVLNPGYVGELTHRSAGWALMGIALTLLTVGALWMKRVTKLSY
jgi:tight adherence protein B